MRTPISLMNQGIDFLLKHKRIFIWGVAIFFIVMGVVALFRGGIGSPPRRTDLTVFLRGAEAIQSGEHLYNVTNARGWNYMYLPLLAILLTPFTQLPLLVNTGIWYILSIASLIGMFYLSARLVQDRRVGRRATLLAALFFLPPLLEVMTRGQIDGIISFFAIAVLSLYLNKKVVWAGILLSFVVALKISPLAPLLVLFIVKREWKMCIAFFLGLFFFVWVYPTVCLGADRNWVLLTQWDSIMNSAVSNLGYKSPLWTQLVSPFAEDNQSLYAVFTRWFWPSEAGLIGHSNIFIKWGVRIGGGVMLAGLAFVSRWKSFPSDRKQIVLEFSLFTVLMFFVSPVASLHHYIILYVMFLATFLYLEELPQRSGAYQSLMWGAIIAFLSFFLGWCFRQPFGYWGFPVIGTFVYWGVLFVFLVKNSFRARLFLAK